MNVTTGVRLSRTIMIVKISELLGRLGYWCYYDHQGIKVIKGFYTNETVIVIWLLKVMVITALTIIKLLEL